MLKAIILLMDTDELAWTVDVMYHSHRKAVTTQLHLLIKVKGDMFDIQDFVIHKKTEGPVWPNIDGCTFLDTIGYMRKQGKLLDIDFVEEKDGKK